MAEKMESGWTIREVCVQEALALSFHDTKVDLVDEAEAKAEVEAFSCSCWFMLTPQTLEGVYLHLPGFCNPLFFLPLAAKIDVKSSKAQEAPAASISGLEEPSEDGHRKCSNCGIGGIQLAMMQLSLPYSPQSLGVFPWSRTGLSQTATPPHTAKEIQYFSAGLGYAPPARLFTPSSITAFLLVVVVVVVMVVVVELVVVVVVKKADSSRAFHKPPPPSVMRRNPFGMDICCRKGSRSPLQELYNPIQSVSGGRMRGSVLTMSVEAAQLSLHGAWQIVWASGFRGFLDPDFGGDSLAAIFHLLAGAPPSTGVQRGVWLVLDRSSNYQEA
ncbi:hypothetical protein LEMLEM_LOCUS1857 [Lemmus lemmus]